MGKMYDGWFHEDIRAQDTLFAVKRDVREVRRSRSIFIGSSGVGATEAGTTRDGPQLLFIVLYGLLDVQVQLLQAGYGTHEPPKMRDFCCCYCC